MRARNSRIHARASAPVFWTGGQAAGWVWRIARFFVLDRPGIHSEYKSDAIDIVALVHGDGKYKPECLPDLLEPLVKEKAAAVFGSRMMTRFCSTQGPTCPLHVS
jgi:hypothetical protein